MTTADLATF